MYKLCTCQLSEEMEILYFNFYSTCVFPLEFTAAAELF